MKNGLGLVLLFIAFFVAPILSWAFISEPMLMAKKGSGSGGLGPPPSGGNVACDYGPNTTLPAGTTAATDLAASGFTHCVLNADFTDTSGATGGNGWVMNNPNTWLNQCKGTTAWGLFWLKWQSGAPGGGFGTNADASGAAPCNRASLINDGGTQVLNFQFAASDIVTTGSGIQGLSLYWPLCGNACTGQRPALPVALYEDITFRLAAGTSQTTTTIIEFQDENTVFDSGPVQTGGFLDMSWMEGLSNGGSSATSLDNYISGTGCSTKCDNGGFRVPPYGAYHTYADLSTTDGSTTLSSCQYVDGAGIVFTSTNSWDGTYCSTWHPLFNPGELADHDRRFFTGLLLFGSSGNTVSINIKNIRIFACANYLGAGNNCTGPVVHH